MTKQEIRYFGKIGTEDRWIRTKEINALILQAIEGEVGQYRFDY